MQLFITKKAWRRTVARTKANVAETSVFGTELASWYSLSSIQHAYALGADHLVQEPVLCEDGVWRVIGDIGSDGGIEVASKTLEFAGLRFSKNALLSSIALGELEVNTQALSSVLRELLKAGDTLEIAKRVCAWGGSTGNRVWGNLERYHGLSSPQGREALRSGLMNWLNAAGKFTDVGDAVEEGAAIRGLGVSYASKHLRLLWPTHYATLDSLISDRLGFAENPYGYRLFIRMLHDFRERSGLAEPIGEIEFGMFGFIRNGVSPA